MIVVLAAALAGLGAGHSVGATYESVSAPSAAGPIDEIVFGKLEELGIPHANLCSDAVFLRRAYLDVIGTLPTAQEASAFLQDRDPGKRGRLIEELLGRDEFAVYWAMKWGDLLRVKAEFPINLWPNAAQAYHRWILESIAANKPYDRFASELLTASGSNFRDPPVNFYRATQSAEPDGIAKAVALTFMGSRAEKWPPERLAGMAAFFSQTAYKQTGEWKEEIVYHDPTKQNAEGTPQAVFPDGKPAVIQEGQDPRAAFSHWLTSPENPWFRRAVVNRVWSWFLGRGVIHEPDDIRPDNPPSIPELLEYLESELVDSGFDLKHIYRLILNSTTYQLSFIPQTGDPRAPAHFAHYPLRRLEAEVLADALCQITGTPESYMSMIPEPYTYIPANLRSVELPDGSITSPFLDLFGRPPRDTGLETERNSKITAAQRLHLLNSSHIQLKLQRSPALRQLVRRRGDPEQVVRAIYLTILSREPSPDEWKAIASYPELRSGTKHPRGDGLIDLAWALLNTDEFLYRH